MHSWSLQPAPLTAYTTYGLNLLTPGSLEHNENDKQKLSIQQPLTTPLTTQTNLFPFLTSQYLSAQPQYFAFNSGFFKAPFNQYTYTTDQQYYSPNLLATFPPAITQKPLSSSLTTKAPATQRPTIREREPTTRKPQGLLQVKPPKLQVQNVLNTPTKVGDFKSDVALLKAVEKINPEYVIEDIINVPGHHVYSTKSMEKQKVVQTKLKSKIVTQSLNKDPAKQQISLQNLKSASNQVKVEATGKTSTKGNIPEIPFGTYFLPYFSQDQVQSKKNGKKTAALILEPHSKAIVGNGGTAISTPISRAYLKRGVTTNVYFNPESVAIAGVGGKAHAQADLELDLIN